MHSANRSAKSACHVERYTNELRLIRSQNLGYAKAEFNVPVNNFVVYQADLVNKGYYSFDADWLVGSIKPGGISFVKMLRSS